MTHEDHGPWTLGLGHQEPHPGITGDTSAHSASNFARGMCTCLCVRLWVGHSSDPIYYSRVDESMFTSSLLLHLDDCGRDVVAVTAINLVAASRYLLRSFGFSDELQVQVDDCPCKRVNLKIVILFYGWCQRVSVSTLTMSTQCPCYLPGVPFPRATLSSCLTCLTSSASITQSSLFTVLDVTLHLGKTFI